MRALVRLGTLLALVGGISVGLSSPAAHRTAPLLSPAEASGNGTPAFSPTPEQLGYFPGQVLVRYKSPDKIPSLRAAQAMPQLSHVGVHAMDIHPNIPGFVVMDVTGDVHQAVKEFEKDPNVLYAEPSYVRYLCRTPNDPLYPQQQNMAMSRAPLGWDIRTSSGTVKIATIDTGVDFNHPDLAGQIVPGGGFNTRGDQSGSAADDSGHGTAVAGVIGALGNNSAFTAGASWDVDILPIRSCGTASLICTIPDEVEAITIAIQQGVKVINLSLGGYSSSQSEGDAIKQAIDADIVVCAAAGNGINGEGQLGKFNDGDPTHLANIFYPAGYDDVIGVGSIDPVPNPEDLSQVRRSRYSNYGDMVDVVAVGSNVITLAPSEQVASPIFRCDPGACYYEQKVGQISGTSFATPLVSGLAGLLRAQFPDLHQAEIAGIITGTARNLGTQDANGRNDDFGFGLVDFFTALSGQGGAVNDTFVVGVAANPIFTNQVYITIKLRQTLLGSPSINVLIKQSGKPDVPLTVPIQTLPSDPNIIFTRFRVDGKADITVDVTGTLPDNSPRELKINYKKEA